jgi:hypothetical protein
LAALLQDPEQQAFVGALRSRGLTDLLNRQEQMRLAQGELSAGERLRTALVVAVWLSERGEREPDRRKRSEFWNQAAELMLKELAAAPAGSRREMARFEWGCALLDRATRLAKRGELSDGGEETREEAASAARGALKAIQTASANLESELNTRESASLATATRLGWPELIGLAGACELGVGAAWLAVARTESEGSGRASALRRAREALDPIGMGDVAHPVGTQALAMLAEIDWIEGKPAEGMARLDAVLESKAPLAQQWEARKLLARIALDSNQADRAAAAMEIATPPAKDGEWETLLIESLLQRSAETRRHAPREAERLKSAAFASLDRLRSRIGGVWQKRGESAAARLLDVEDLAGDARLLVRFGDLQRSAGNPAKARAAYEAALRIVEGGPGAPSRLEIRFGLACALRDLGELESAGAEFESLARESSDAALSGRCWAAAVSAMEAMRGAAPSRKLEEAYLRLLESCAESAVGDVAEAAAWKRGEALESLGRAAEAAASFRRIERGSPRYPAAVLRLAAIQHARYAKLAPDELAGLADEVRAAVAELEERWASITEGDAPGAARQKGTAALLLADLMRLDPVGRGEEALELLERELTAEWADPPRAQAESLLLRDYVRLGRFEDARSLVEGDRFEARDGLRRVLASIDLADAALTDEARGAAAAFVEAGAERLLSAAGGVEPEDRFHLRRLLAEARLAQGDAASAARLFDQLALEKPGNLRIVQGLAASEYSQGRYEESRKHWSAVQRGVARGRPEWFRAVYHLISCQHRLGLREEASRNLNRLMDLHPDLGGEAWRSAFERLAEELNGGASGEAGSAIRRGT